MTTPSFSPNAVEVEYNIGKNIVDVAVERGVEHIIFSTLPSVSNVLGEKYTKVTPFDAKPRSSNTFEDFRSKVRSSLEHILWKTCTHNPSWHHKKNPDGTWVLARHVSSSTQFPYVAVDDIGKFVGAILEDPVKFEGKIFHATAASYSLAELAAILSKATGKTVVNKQISSEEFEKSLPFSGDTASIFVEIVNFQEEFGYFGPGTEKLISWSLENAQGKVATLEEYLVVHPLQLE